MARDPLFWIATTVRGLVKRVDELNAILVKAGPPGVHLAEPRFVFDPNAPEFVPKQYKPEDVPSIPPGSHVHPLVFHSALEHAEAVLQELLLDPPDSLPEVPRRVVDLDTDVLHVAPPVLLPEENEFNTEYRELCEGLRAFTLKHYCFKSNVIFSDFVNDHGVQCERYYFQSNAKSNAKSNANDSEDMDFANAKSNANDSGDMDSEDYEELAEFYNRQHMQHFDPDCMDYEELAEFYNRQHMQHLDPDCMDSEDDADPTSEAFSNG